MPASIIRPASPRRGSASVQILAAGRPKHDRQCILHRAAELERVVLDGSNHRAARRTHECLRLGARRQHLPEILDCQTNRGAQIVGDRVRISIGDSPFGNPGRTRDADQKLTAWKACRGRRLRWRSQGAIGLGDASCPGRGGSGRRGDGIEAGTGGAGA